MPGEPLDPRQGPPEEVVGELLLELETAFDLATPIGEETLGAAMARRIRSLELGGVPAWGSGGTLTQLAKADSGALDFYYRPHLFPEMDAALRLGHRLQFDLLPRSLPAESPLKIAAVLESYCHLSGDLLGWRWEEDELFVWIADVSGHGVRAGLAAAVLHFLIDDVEVGLPPDVFAQQVNERMLAARNPQDPRALFATALWLRARPDGRIRYASSGHNSMLWLCSTGEVEPLASTGKPLGLLPGQVFGQRQLDLGHDEVLCLFTDGLVEAPSPSDEEFGTERLAGLLEARGEPLELARRIYRAVRAHQATNLFEDDLTFMVVERAV